MSTSIPKADSFHKTRNELIIVSHVYENLNLPKMNTNKSNWGFKPDVT